MVDLNTVCIGTKGGLIDYLTKIRDPRKPRGIRSGAVRLEMVSRIIVALRVIRNLRQLYREEFRNR